MHKELWLDLLTFLVFVADQSVLDELFENLVASSMFESSYGRYQVDGDDLVVLHSHFNLSKDKSQTVLDISILNVLF